MFVLAPMPRVLGDRDGDEAIMDLIVYLNGEFVKANEAKISIYDHGFLYGDGAFETLRAYQGHVFRFQDHVQRLYYSLKQLYMDLPVAPHLMHKALKLLLQHNHLSDACLRITVTRGEGPVGLDFALCPHQSVLIIAEPVRKYSANWYLQGISIVIVSQRKVPDVCFPAAVKSNNYLANVLAKKKAKEKNAQEGIMLNLEGYLAEGTSSNIFLVKGKTLYTPAVSSGILSGITRNIVIQLAAQRHLEVVETHILPAELISADECFITNTTMEVMPVSSCDGTVIGRGQPGKITRLLMKDFKHYVQREIHTEREAKV